jgi:hypothetical protein
MAIAASGVVRGRERLLSRDNGARIPTYVLTRADMPTRGWCARPRDILTTIPLTALSVAEEAAMIDLAAYASSRSPGGRVPPIPRPARGQRPDGPLLLVVAPVGTTLPRPACGGSSTSTPYRPRSSPLGRRWRSSRTGADPARARHPGAAAAPPGRPLACRSFARRHWSHGGAWPGPRTGLIHKDLTPAHVLVHAATGQVWLMGFGIASRLPARAPDPRTARGAARWPTRHPSRPVAEPFSRRAQ